MEKKKFMNGTEFGSKSEPATRSSSAPDGAATGGVELDDDSLASITGGRVVAAVFPSGGCDRTYVYLFSGPLHYCKLAFSSESAARNAVSELTRLKGSDVSAGDILSALSDIGLTPTNVGEFRSDWS